MCVCVFHVGEKRLRKIRISSKSPSKVRIVAKNDYFSGSAWVLGVGAQVGAGGSGQAGFAFILLDQ